MAYSPLKIFPWQKVSLAVNFPIVAQWTLDIEWELS